MDRALQEALFRVEQSCDPADESEEVEALHEALRVALDLLDEEWPTFCDNCDEGNEVDEHDMCSSCLHNAYRSGWEPGADR